MNAHITKINSEELKDVSTTLEDLLKKSNKDDMLSSLLNVLALEDKQFNLVAPGIIQAYEQSLNNASDKLILTQALNASGTKAEDLTEAFNTIVEEVEKMSISKEKQDFMKQVIAIMINAINDTEGISKRIVQIPIELCHENAIIPQYAHLSDSGLDVYALDDITVRPGETVLVPTGIKVAIPAGYELQVRPKSGRALKTKLRVANTPGTIDQGYREEIKVIIENVDPPIRKVHVDNMEDINTPIRFSDIEFGQSYTIGKGEKFCQLVLAEVPKAAFYRVESIQEMSDRKGGFGSTGLK